MYSPEGFSFRVCVLLNFTFYLFFQNYLGLLAYTGNFKCGKQFTILVSVFHLGDV